MPSAKPSSRGRRGGPSGGAGTSTEKLPSKRDLELQLQPQVTTTRNPFQKHKAAADTGDKDASLTPRAHTRSGAEFGQVFPKKVDGGEKDAAGAGSGAGSGSVKDFTLERKGEEVEGVLKRSFGFGARGRGGVRGRGRGRGTFSAVETSPRTDLEPAEERSVGSRGGARGRGRGRGSAYTLASGTKRAAPVDSEVEGEVKPKRPKPKRVISSSEESEAEVSSLPKPKTADQVDDLGPDQFRRSDWVHVDRDWAYEYLERLLNAHSGPYEPVDLESIADEAVRVFEEFGLLGQPLNPGIEEAGPWLQERLQLELLAQQEEVYLDRIEEVQDADSEKEDVSLKDTFLVQRQRKGAKTAAAPFAASPGMFNPQSQGRMTPALGQYLQRINGFLKAQNEQGLASIIPLEPPFSPDYQKIIEELRQVYPAGKEEALEEKCSETLTVARDGVDGSPSWSQFTRFIAQYLQYMRDVILDQDKFYEIYEMLYEVQKRANSALTHQSLGSLMLPIVVGFAKVICKLAIFIDVHPEMFAHLKPSRGGGDDDGPSSTLPERAAELLRGGLTTCLNDRFSSLDAEGKPEGKKRGIYLIANICLKIFFQCRKTRNASMIFTNIGNLSPPLSAYPKSQRITYLYYLGRFWFQNSHFDRARLALQTAYNEISVQDPFIRQRRHVLIFLIASNIILGRFPTAETFGHPGAQGLADRFLPLMQAIRSGNLAQFRQHLDPDGPHAAWFLHFRMLLQLRDRCEILVWRSLIRKTWMLCGTPYVAGGQPPLVDIKALVTVFSALERAAEKPQESAWVDPDFDGIEFEETYPDPTTVTPMKIESILSSLVTQGFLQGFIAHRQSKFVFTRVKQAGGNVLAAGFPTPWKVIERKLAREGFGDEVPGWRKQAPGSMAAGGLGGGMVINMSGARPVGAM